MYGSIQNYWISFHPNLEHSRGVARDEIGPQVVPIPFEKPSVCKEV